MTSTATTTTTTTTTLIDFVAATPHPLVLHLVPLAPLVHAVRHAADVLAWTAAWEESALLLALWWSLCLFAEQTLKFFLPLALLFVLVLHQHTATPAQPLPATDAVLHTLLDDLAAIHALLPAPPSARPAPDLAAFRIAALLYLPYLLLTHLVPLRICIALAGTLVITHRARWARNARAALARSAHLRSAYYRILDLLAGTPPPSRPTSDYVSAHTHADGDDDDDDDDDPAAPRPSPPLRFLFTIYENQRWWVGLDWTAALLPGERPSWCSTSQVPLSPPSTFSLPSPTTAFVPVGKHGRAKRMARWSWEEPEWRVVVRKDANDGLWRIEKTPPRDKDSSDESGSAARVLRAVKSADSPPDPPADPSVIPANADDIVTDPDGWVYGDNKWEGASSKGGMGKYTRYRRWTRIAVLSETVELVGPGEFGVLRDSGTLSTLTTSVPPSVVTPGANSPTASSFSDWESAGSAPEYQKDPAATRSVLKQRLKAAMDGSGH